MTEVEWVACGDPKTMLEFLRGKASDRKLILFSFHHWLDEMAADDEWYHEIEVVVEEVIDGKTHLSRLICEFGTFDFSAVTPTPSWWADAVATERQVRPPQVRTAKAQSLRCIFGNPFRPLSIDPSWLTTDVVVLATGIYQDRAFDRMPILADALQDAGCDNADILDHCRGPGPHVRGCWVVDLVLGKE
jgi:hypothetical protein